MGKTNRIQLTHTDVPAELIPPGETLRAELGARGLSQAAFAETIDRPVRIVNEIITGKKGITPETALQFEAALGVSAQFWMNLETRYRLNSLRAEAALSA